MSSPSPSLIWWNGRIVPWSEATVHVTSETAMRGTNVFEGLRAYWQIETGRFAIVALEEHLERLAQSAHILSLPVGPLINELRTGLANLISALGYRENLYLRPTIYLDEGDYAAAENDLKVGAFIVGRPTGARTTRPTACIVSTWQRFPDLTLPPLAKIGATYTAFRLARREAATAGADEAILLNANGKVTETGGAAIFVVRGNRVCTPPVSDGILEGVTRRIVIDLLSDRLGICVTECSISRSELYVADEIFLCGTLDEIRAVGSVDKRSIRLAPGPVMQAVRELYIGICEGRETQQGVGWLRTLSLESSTPASQQT